MKILLLVKILMLFLIIGCGRMDYRAMPKATPEIALGGDMGPEEEQGDPEPTPTVTPSPTPTEEPVVEGMNFSPSYCYSGGEVSGFWANPEPTDAEWNALFTRTLSHFNSDGMGNYTCAYDIRVNSTMATYQLGCSKDEDENDLNEGAIPGYSIETSVLILGVNAFACQYNFVEN